MLSQGNLIMNGDDYQAWETNEYAWSWVAGKLGVVITGEHQPEQPVTDEPVQ
jgi:hypothetical protein